MMAEKQGPPSTPTDVSESKRNFMEETPVHGVDCANHSRSTVERAFYMSCILVAVVMTSVGIAFTFKDLNERFKYTTTRVHENGVREFPDVSICNMNPLRVSQFVLLSPEGSETDKGEPDFGNQLGTQEQPPSRKKRGAGSNHNNRVLKSPVTSKVTELDDKKAEGLNKDWSWLEPYLRSYSVTPQGERKSPQRRRRQIHPEEEGREDSYSFTIQEDFYINRYSGKLSGQQRRLAGHQISHMLLSCSFNGYQCLPEHFIHFLDPLLGNCYTFKPKRVQTSKPTGFLARRPGLEMELNVELPEYLQGVAENVGARIVIGEYNAPVLPNGINSIFVSPGTDSHLRVAVEEHVRDGDCHDAWSEDTEDMNIHPHRRRSSYSREACLESCDQSQAIRKCSCCLYTSPCPRGNRFCTGKDVTCLSSTDMRTYEKDACHRHCKMQCRYRKYLVSNNAGKWPRPFNEAELRHKINEAYIRSNALVSTPEPTVPFTSKMPLGELGNQNETLQGPLENGETGENNDGTNIKPPKKKKNIKEDKNKKQQKRRRRRRHVELYSRDKDPQILDWYRVPQVTLSKGSPTALGRFKRQAGEYPGGDTSGNIPDYTNIAISDTVLKLRVQLESMDLTVHETGSWMTWHHVLAQIGGHMALWAGISVMALVHAGHALSRWVWAGLRKRRGVGSIDKVMAFE
ncbi:hypothetical protein EGW08_003918 [Elysia chlorotica]|uniref:Uncharacterized protein n=1 Tax=Elysia chlorotica TaxID=188477 RepID=A0A3S1ACI5_ELYCH|nr:hypothetical protein EGW08_003918 [Elysia chlorotica]